MTRIYVDSNILIAYYSTDRAEESKKNMVQRALEIFAHAKDISLCTSMWAVTEMVNILISSKKMDRGEVANIESRLVSERRIANLKLVLLDVSRAKITILRNSSTTSGNGSSNTTQAWAT